MAEVLSNTLIIFYTKMPKPTIKFQNFISNGLILCKNLIELITV